MVKNLLRGGQSRERSQVPNTQPTASLNTAVTLRLTQVGSVKVELSIAVTRPRHAIRIFLEPKPVTGKIRPGEVMRVLSDWVCVFGVTTGSCILHGHNGYDFTSGTILSCRTPILNFLGKEIAHGPVDLHRCAKSMSNLILVRQL